MIGIERVSGSYRITTVNAEGEHFVFTSERVVNAAGLQSDAVARMLGKHYLLRYCKGDYFSIAGANEGMVGRLVYPVPEEDHAGLGVHLTLDLAGRMRLGPDAVYTERVEDYRVVGEDGGRVLCLRSQVSALSPQGGHRPRYVRHQAETPGKGEGFRDFLISEDLPGFVNMVGISRRD
ncbi:MAG: FAD-dependent oxidoreductase [Thermodesulfovibrionales bacterium]